MLRVPIIRRRLCISNLRIESKDYPSDGEYDNPARLLGVVVS
jgi:hypothetical protein